MCFLDINVSYSIQTSLKVVLRDPGSDRWAFWGANFWLNSKLQNTATLFWDCCSIHTDILDSSRSINAFMRQRTGPSTVRIWVWRLLGAKPVPIECSGIIPLTHSNKSQANLNQNTTICHTRQLTWKYRLWIVNLSFCRGFDVLTI